MARAGRTTLFFRTSIEILTYIRWEFNILDSSNNTLQAFNTTCHYFGDTAYEFALDDFPVDQPCNNPNVTFSLYPTGTWFQLNVTHLWGSCGTRYLFSLAFLFHPSPLARSLQLYYLETYNP